MTAINHQVASAYGKAQSCAPQPWMVTVLLKGVLDHLAGAQQAVANNRRSEAVSRANKAVAILQGLRDNLRPEVSLRLTRLLDQFYRTTVLWIAHLMRTGFDDGTCAQVMANVKLVHDAWASIEDKKGGKD